MTVSHTPSSAHLSEKDFVGVHVHRHGFDCDDFPHAFRHDTYVHLNLCFVDAGPYDVWSHVAGHRSLSLSGDDDDACDESFCVYVPEICHVIYLLTDPHSEIEVK